MPEKKRTPHRLREEMRGVSQSKGHLHDKSAEELLTELEAKLDSMTDQTYDEELVDAYLEALDEKAPLPKQFDVESSWNQFRSKHSILFDADDILPNPKHSRSFSHKFRFRKAIPQLVAAAAIVGVLGMLPRPQVSTCLVHSVVGPRKPFTLLLQKLLRLPLTTQSQMEMDSTSWNNTPRFRMPLMLTPFLIR